MNKKVDLVEREVEVVEFVDLGNAAEETRQTIYPQSVPDNPYGLGWWAR